MSGLFSVPENIFWRFSLGATTETWRRLQLSVSKICKAGSLLPPILPSLHLQVTFTVWWLLSLVNGQILPGGGWKPWSSGVKNKAWSRSCPTLEQPQPHGTQALHVLGPRRGKASEISLFFPCITCHHTQLYILFSHDLVIFRSNQSQYNASPWVFVMRATMMRNTAKIIISFITSGFILFVSGFKLLLLRTYFQNRVFHLSLSSHTLTHLFFPISPKTFWHFEKCFTGSILVSYLVFLPFLRLAFY